MVTAEYRNKRISASEAAALVRSGDWVDYGLSSGMPHSIDKALAARTGELRDVKVRGFLSLRPLAIVEADPEQRSFRYMSWHIGGLERKLYMEGLCDYIPMAYRNQPEIYRKCLDVDIAFMSVPPMDRHGYFNFSLTNSASMAILETAKTVVLEINENLPRCLGGSEECIHISKVDYIVEGENPPLVEVPSAPLTDVDRRIAEHIVSQIRDGATIQLGIGAIANSVGKLIAQSDLKDLGMHTELLVDAYLDIYKSGKLTNARKNIDRHKGVWTFCMGGKELYEWVGENPGLACYPVNYTNSPEIMARNNDLITINCCIEADLRAQVSSESTGIRQISGTGGQLDFVAGSYISEGGKSFICMASTYTDKQTGETRSRIIPALPPGGVVTAPRSSIHMLATEWGTANLAGCSTEERAKRIIGLAHPDFRDGLFREAEKQGIWRRSVK